MLRKAGYVAGTIAGLLILLIVGLELYFTSDRLKSLTEPPIEEALQRDISIGTMSLEFIETFPSIGVSMTDFMIPGSRQDTAASFREVVVGVELFPLLQNQINISELNINRPMVHYKIYEDGSSNFDFEPTEVQEEPPADTAATAMNLNVPEVNISNAHFAYSDFTSNTEASIKNLSGTVGLSYTDVIETNLDLAIEGINAGADGTTFVEGLPLTIKETSIINLENETITLKDGGIAIKGLQLNINGIINNWSADAPGVDLNFETSSDQFGELLKLIPESYQSQIGSFDAGGSLAFSGSVKGNVGGDDWPQLNATLNVNDAFLKHPDLKEQISGIAIQAGITNEKISIDRFEASAGKNSINADGVILKPLAEKPTAQLTANASADLSTIPDFYPIDTDTFDMRGQFEASISLDGSLNDPQKAIKSAYFNLENGYLAYHELGKPVESLTITGEVDGTQLRLETFDMKSGKNSLNISGLVNRFQSENPDVDIAVISNFDLAEVPAFYSLEPYINQLSGNIMADLNIQGPASSPGNMEVRGSLRLENANFSGDSLPTAPITNMNATINLSSTRIDIKNTGMHIGPSDITFNGTVDRYMELAKDKIEHPVKIRGELTSKLLNYDAMFPVEEADKPVEAEPIPMEIPNIDAHIELSADSIVYMGTGFYDARADLSVVRDNITISNMNTGIMSGRAKGKLVWNITEPLATNMKFTGSVDSVASGRFFRDFHVLGEESTFNEHITGDFNASVDYSSDMDQYLEPVLKSSVAKGHFGMTESMIKDHPAQLALARFLNANDLKQMKLDEWQADYTLEEGILELKNMELRSGDLAMELEGTQNLLNDELNYKATLWVPQKYAGNLSKVISSRGVKALTEEDGRVKIPLRITGTSEDVKYRPDKEVINDLIKEFLKDNVKDKIGNIFGNG